MKKIGAFLLLVLMSILLITEAMTEDAVPTAKFERLTVPLDAEYIDLGSVIVDYTEDDKFIAFLEKFPNLKKVDMFSSKLIRRRINKYVKRFPDVEFGWTMVMASREIRTDATAFSMRNSDRSPRYDAEEFSLLKYCPNLLALDLGHNRLRDGLDILYDLPQLKVLILVDNDLNDITPLASLKNLEYLEIFYNDIRDVTPLQGLTNLVDLNICYNRIKDLTPLENLTNLRRLWIGHSNSHNVYATLDEAVVARLQQALPNTYIDSVSSSVEGGWREGPHYEAVRRMFQKGGSYEPFEDVE